MKIVRFRSGDDIAYGLAEAAGVTLYNGSPFVAWEATETLIPWDAIQLLAPVLPSKVVGVANNYADLADEVVGSVSEEPVIYLKPATSVVGPESRVVHPDTSEDVQHGASLAVVIGRLARHVKAEDAGQYIFGYTAANDITARDLQRRDGQWARGKGFDTFCPLGPGIETELDPLEKLSIVGRVNGEVREGGFTSDMVFGVAELIEFISQVMTLLPGDVVLTGTPPGVGTVEPGDTVEVEIDGIGTLLNRVVKAT